MEITYAAVTGVLMAAAGFVAVISPVLYGVLHGEARKGCITGAVIVATALFCGRVAFTLRRFEQPLPDCADADARAVRRCRSGIRRSAAGARARVPRSGAASG